MCLCVRCACPFVFNMLILHEIPSQNHRNVNDNDLAYFEAKRINSVTDRKPLRNKRVNETFDSWRSTTVMA